MTLVEVLELNSELKVIKHIKSEYKTWLIGVFMLPFIIGFEKSFSEIEAIPELSNWIIILRILCLTFVACFFIFLMFSNELGFNERIEKTEYEHNDLTRFKRNLKNSFTAYTIALLIWIVVILTIIFEYGKTQNIWKMFYLLAFPIIFIVFMIYIYNGIKKAYNTI